MGFELSPSNLARVGSRRDEVLLVSVSLMLGCYPGGGVHIGIWGDGFNTEQTKL